MTVACCTTVLKIQEYLECSILFLASFLSGEAELSGSGNLLERLAASGVGSVRLFVRKTRAFLPLQVTKQPLDVFNAVGLPCGSGVGAVMET